MNVKTAELLLLEGYTNVFVVDPPDDLNDYILISNSGGFGVESKGDTELSLPTIQIIVKDKTYKDCKDTIDGIIKYLQFLTLDEINTKLTDNNSRLAGYYLQSDILELGKDEQIRYGMSTNFMAYKNLRR